MIKNFFAALTGALSIAAYAPLEWWWLMFPCVMSLYFLLQNSSPKQSFYLAFSFGLAQFGIGASWVYVSLTHYGNMPMLMAGAGVLLFVSALALFTGLIGLCFSRLKTQTHFYLNTIIFSSLWVIAEWLRSVVLTGFPWLDVGYSQTTQWLSAYAPIGSVYLVSFFCIFVSALLLSCVQHKNICAALGIALVACTGFVLKDVPWSQVAGKAHDIVLVQGNIPIQQKWQASYQNTLFTRYSTEIHQYKADLVILPETALPVYLDQTNAHFWQQLQGQNNAILSGIIERDFQSNQIFNSAVLSCNDNSKNNDNNNRNSDLQIYQKQHLVPFGEYLPLRKYFSWVLDYLQLPMSDFSSGSRTGTRQNELRQKELSCEGLNINVSICYEDAFASGMRNSLSDSSAILVNISEDAWFGDSLAPHQRVQMAQMRAQELSRPMLRSANSGPSTYINHQGKVLASTKQFTKESLLVSVSPRTGKTPFVRFGLWIVWLSFAFLVIVSIRQILTNRKS